MKCSFLSLMMLVMCLQACTPSSTEGWNATTAIYSNPKRHITWKLPDDLNWKERPRVSEGTLLKVKDEELQVMVMLDEVRDNDVAYDVWDCEPLFESEKYQGVYMKLAQKNGMTYNGVKTEKSTVCGLHAIKACTKMSKYVSEYDTTVFAIFYSYYFVKNGYLYTVSIEALSITMDYFLEFELLKSMIFSGFEIK